MNITSYRDTLLSRRNELGGRASREDIIVERLSDAVDDVQHSADREIAITNLSRHWETFKEIDAALARVEDGSYGTCLRCDEPIGEKRLRAIPWASRCIRCQEAHDAENNYQQQRFMADAA